MIPNLPRMTQKQLAPNCEEALGALRWLLYHSLYNPNAQEPRTLRGRRHIAEASLQRLEIELGFRPPPVPRHKGALPRIKRRRNK